MNTWAYNIYNMLRAEELNEKPSYDQTIREEESTTIEMEDMRLDVSPLGGYCIRVIDPNENEDDELISIRQSPNRILHRWLFFVVSLVFVMVVGPTVAISRRSQSLEKSANTDDDMTSNYIDGTGNGDIGIPTEWNFKDPKPFSSLDPVEDLKLYNFLQRPTQSAPSSRLDPLRSEITTRSSNSYGANPMPLPTNAWYQNMLLLRENEQPSENHRAYAMPYVVDSSGKIPGLRVHTFQKVANYNTVNLNVNQPHALTLGATLDFRQSNQLFNAPKGYSVHAATELGFTLEWDFYPMKSSIVKGMPYATMEYTPRMDHNNADLPILPTIYSEINLNGPIKLDNGEASVSCDDSGGTFTVNQELELRFMSGVTWLVFFSRPAMFQCTPMTSGRFMLQVVEDFNIKDPLIIRAAMVVPRSNSAEDPVEFSKRYKAFLRRHYNVYPGSQTHVAQSVSNDKAYANIIFDWDVQTMGNTSSNEKLAMFALPHHQDKLKDVKDQLCTFSLLGSVCPVIGETWSIIERLPEVSFRASRRPEPAFLPALAQALKRDILYQLPANFQIGAADTYFSGKALGKLARILLIAEEVKEVCSNSAENDDDYADVCSNASPHIPTEQEVSDALTHLKKGVEIWLRGNGQAPFVYDPSWGGVVSCGCTYVGGKCLNKVPNCPAFVDKLLNFGGGFYNDHHFHYGYHIYAAAALSHFDKEWGRENFEQVLLLVRDIANPSPDDASFPIYRHKDWYQGHSWANGISVTFPNGMNQESSSEAIASYEAVALFGKAMRSAFHDVGNREKIAVCDEIHRVGLVLTATELRSTKRYYQIQKNSKIYPDEYEANVVGIMWSTMIHYGTWFGNLPYYIYGIQLLPLTPIAEERDDIGWSKEMFAPFSKSCDSICTASGWSVGVLAILATIGHKETAFEQAQQLSQGAFETPGGGGHSKSNTLWYLSTRPTIDQPYVFDDGSRPDDFGKDLTCFQPDTCTDQELNKIAGGYSCRDRMLWLMENRGLSERGACREVAVTEFPAECGRCDPKGGSMNNNSNSGDEFCNIPSRCTDAVLDTMAEGHTCRARIKWLQESMKMSHNDACFQIARHEYPAQCGRCDPNGNRL